MKRSFISLCAVSIAILSTSASLMSGGPRPGRVYSLPDFERVPGAQARITRGESVCAASYTRNLEPGAYTIWWIVFNAPEGCQFGLHGIAECSLQDLFDGNGESSLFWAGSQVIGPSGEGVIDACVEVGGELPGEVLIPGGLTNPNAEVHAVYRSHGAAADSPTELGEQLLFFSGFCNPDCQDVQVAVHLSDQGRGNGGAGGSGKPATRRR